MELYKSICVCSSDWRTASKTTKQKVKYIFNWVFQLWHNFLLQPLELIFKCFTSPTQGKYAWTGLDKVEAAFLNDFRLSRGYCMAWVIEFAWRCSLQIEETQKYFCHRFIHTKIKQHSFFATGVKPIEFVGADSQRNERQTDMMDNRLNIFEFTHQILNNESLGIETCPKSLFDLLMFCEESQWTLI